MGLRGHLPILPRLSTLHPDKRMKRSTDSNPLTDRLAALAEPIRLRMCRLLEQQELSVGEVAKVVQLPQSTVSRHLKVLTGADWTQKRAEGTATMYRLVLDDLPDDARRLWVTVRAQFGGDPHVGEDDRRLKAVLSERRSDSLEFFGRVAGEWAKLRRELFGSEFTARALLALLPSEWSVADFGCGTGNAAEMLAPYVREMVLIDQSEPMLRAARECLSEFENIRYVLGSAMETGLEGGSVDAATCLLVLHHLDEPASVVKEMARVVRPGGKVLIVDMVEHDRSIYRHTMGHVHLGFSREELEGFMVGAGLERPHGAILPSDPEGRGPDLLVMVATAPGARGGNGSRKRST